MSGRRSGRPTISSTGGSPSRLRATAGTCHSVVNSVKRALNDTAAKARHWHERFGDMLIPVALLSGVFGLDSLKSAQASGLYLVWSHDLESFALWLAAQ